VVCLIEAELELVTALGEQDWATAVECLIAVELELATVRAAVDWVTAVVQESVIVRAAAEGLAAAVEIALVTGVVVLEEAQAGSVAPALEQAATGEPQAWVARAVGLEEEVAVVVAAASVAVAVEVAAAVEAVVAEAEAEDVGGNNYEKEYTNEIDASELESFNPFLRGEHSGFHLLAVAELCFASQRANFRSFDCETQLVRNC
jgi:hypothetical protein